MSSSTPETGKATPMTTHPETERIRWSAASPGSLATLAGRVGTLDAALFNIFEPHAREDCWILTSALPGFLGYRRFEARPDTTSETLKAEAERWLEEFVSSLGVAFPEDAARQRDEILRKFAPPGPSRPA